MNEDGVRRLESTKSVGSAEAAFFDWKVEEDLQNFKEKALFLRGLAADRVYRRAFVSPSAAQGFMRSPRTQWRLRALQKSELLTGRRVAGTVVEIGAGTGWCSAFLSQRSDVEQVYALDYDRVSVEELMPLVFKNLEARADKIHRTLGSYNHMLLDDCSVDHVVSIGALHHSENLPLTMKECARVLKPGGILFATEPCEHNSMSLSEQRSRETDVVSDERTEKLYGESVGIVQNRDNSDHYVRLCEYEAFGYAAGFEVTALVFDHTDRSGGRSAKLSRMLAGRFLGDRLLTKPTYKGFVRQVLYPYFAVNAFSSQAPLYDELLLVLRKE